MKIGEEIMVFDNRKEGDSARIVHGRIIQIEKTHVGYPCYEITLDTGHMIRIFTKKLEEEK